MSSIGGSAAGMGTLRAPTLGLVFVLLMVAWVVFDINQLSSPALCAGRLAYAVPSLPRVRPVAAAVGPGPAMASAAAAVSVPSAPATSGSGGAGSARESAVPDTGGLLGNSGVATGCRIAMGVTMALMLILMI